MPPLVSVILIVFNRDNLLNTSAQSILNQTYWNLELIIYDDASTEHSTRDLIESLVK